MSRHTRTTHFLRVANKHTLSPGEHVAVWFTCPTMELSFLTPRQLSRAYAGIRLANGVADIVPNVKFESYLTNFSDHVRKLPKGMILSTAASHPVQKLYGEDAEVLFASFPWRDDTFCTAPLCERGSHSQSCESSVCSSCLVVQ